MLLLLFKDDDDEETLWIKHVQNKSHLKKYAQAMHILATEHWENKVMLNYKLKKNVSWFLYHILTRTILYNNGVGIPLHQTS